MPFFKVGVNCDRGRIKTTTPLLFQLAAVLDNNHQTVSEVFKVFNCHVATISTVVRSSEFGLTFSGDVLTMTAVNILVTNYKNVKLD